MGLDQLGVLTVGTLVPKEGEHSLLCNPLLVIRIAGHRSSLAPQGHDIRAGPMAHMVNKANTRWLAANLISGHLAHAGNHRHGTAGRSHGWCSAQSAHRPWEVSSSSYAGTGSQHGLARTTTH